MKTSSSPTPLPASAFHRACIAVIGLLAAGMLAFSSRAHAQCVFPLPGLVSWWSGDGNANDVFGGNPGVLSTNGVTYMPGIVGRAFNFDGTNGFVRLPDNLFPLPGVTPFSFEIWFQTTAGGVILGQQAGQAFDSSGGNVPAVYIGTDGMLYVQTFYSGRVNRSIVSPQAVNDGVFHHMASTFDGVSRVVYLDGVRIGSRIFAQSPFATIYRCQLGTGDTGGGWPAAPGGWYSFKGLLDEAAVYNRALSSNEIYAIYSAGSAGKCRAAESFSLIQSNDFDNEIIDQLKWSDTDTDTVPNGNRRFFGPYGNTPVTLTLSNLPAHTNLTLEFDLLVIGPWDGLAGINLMNVSVVGGPVLLNSTFQNGRLGGPQSYPSQHRTNDNLGQAGAVEVNTLGYASDSVYRLRLNFPHSATNRIVLRFAATNLVSAQGEFWGADNLRVYANGPTVLLTKPTAHVALFAPTNVLLSAQASSMTENIRYVQFLANHVLVGTVSNAPYTMTWSNIQRGFYVMTARATDDVGRSSDSLTTFQVGGLLGEYFTNMNLTGSPVTNIDSAVNFNWGTNAPTAGLPTDSFSVRWTGEYVPRYNGNYILSTEANDGLRLWIDGYRWVDDWRPRNTTSNGVVIPLVANQRYRIQMEMFDSNSVAVASLRAQGPNDPFQVIPASRLVPPVPGVNRPPNMPVITTPGTNTMLSPFGDAVNPTNFQMIADFFSDPDTGQMHRESDWDILQAGQEQPVWQDYHSTHLLTNWLTNGTFTGASAVLPSETSFIVRVRHRDNSGVASDWGATTQRVFNTTSPLISSRPFIVSRYQTNLLIAGETVVLGVAATNVSPWVRYQWLRNGTPIPNAITNTLILYDITPAEAGGYTVIVSNPAGSRTNSPLDVVVNTSFTARLETRFDTDNEGWSAIGNAPSTNLTFFSPGGNPGGYIYTTDPAGAAGGAQLYYWIAPTNYLGNKSDCYGGYLSFDLRINETRNHVSANDVVLEGGGLTLVLDTPFNPTNGWTFYRIPLVETAGWQLDSTNGLFATQSELLQVLANLKSLRIRAGFSTRVEVDYLDNVRLLAPLCATNAILVALHDDGNDTQLEWPTNACGFALQSSAVLAPAGWDAVTLPIVQTNGFNRVTVSPLESAHFFRLIRP